MKAIRLKEKGKEPMVFNTNDALARYWGVSASDASHVLSIVKEYERLCNKYNIESIEETDDFAMPQEYIDKGYKIIQCTRRLIYAANKEGDVISIVNGKKLIPQISAEGYCYVALNNKRYTIHRIVALLFVPNPNRLPQVNHINEDKSDNRACNLEWCDNKYNCNYGLFRNKCKSEGKPIPIRAVKDGEELFFNSIKEASDITGVDTKSIRYCLKGKRKSAKNFYFYFILFKYLKINAIPGD